MESRRTACRGNARANVARPVDRDRRGTLVFGHDARRPTCARAAPPRAASRARPRSSTQVSVKSESFDAFCRACLDLLKAQRTRHLVIGGIAVTAVGEPRLTADMDVILYASL